MEHRRDPIIRTIGALKLLKAAALIVFGIAALELIGRDVAYDLTRWIAELHLDPGNHHLARLIAKLSGASDHTLEEIGIASLCYASLFTVEGVGLILRKVWAEYVTSIITISFVPLEVYELVEHASVVKLVVLLVNLAIVAYLVARLRDQGHWPFRARLAP
jgi:uncharacterized membrane protein (DUF2068 family)